MSESTSSRVTTQGFRGSLGVARRDITPPVGIRNRNWGAATSDVAEGIHRPLELTALAIASDTCETTLLIVAVDGTDFRRVDDWDRLKSDALPALGLREDQILVNLSHTHSGPVLVEAHQDLPGGKLIPPYMRELREALISAGQEALSSLSPATLDWAQGHCCIAANRDLDVEGRPLVGFNPDMVADDTILVGRVTRANGSPLATLVNYACHPTTLGWQNDQLSPDYVGALRETVEHETLAPCIFLQGASGDLAPRLQYVADTSLADRYGRAIGLAALSALATMPPAATDLVLSGSIESGAPLAIWTAEPSALSDDLRLSRQSVDLPLQPLPTIEELEAEWADLPAQSRDERLRRVRDKRADYLDVQSRPDTVAHPVWAAKIGDALLIAHPGEAYSYLQTELRSRFPETPVVVMNLTNGPGFVYLPNKRAYELNAYAAWQTVLAPGALETLLEVTTQALADLQAPGTRPQVPSHTTAGLSSP